MERGHLDICMSLPRPYIVVIASQVASSTGEEKGLRSRVCNYLAGKVSD